MISIRYSEEKKIIGPFYNYLPCNSKRVPLRFAVIDELLLPDVHVDYGNAPVVGRSTPVQQNCSYYILSLLRMPLIGSFIEAPTNNDDGSLAQPVRGSPPSRPRVHPPESTNYYYRRYLTRMIERSRPRWWKASHQSRDSFVIMQIN